MWKQAFESATGPDSGKLSSLAEAPRLQAAFWRRMADVALLLGLAATSSWLVVR